MACCEAGYFLATTFRVALKLSKILSFVIFTFTASCSEIAFPTSLKGRAQGYLLRGRRPRVVFVVRSKRAGDDGAAEKTLAEAFRGRFDNFRSY
ncbi:MAG: hypothetical protein ACJAVK_002234 [Akkermansiaceae bacterium]|jgi:hypothetical protein